MKSQQGSIAGGNAVGRFAVGRAITYLCFGMILASLVGTGRADEPLRLVRNSPGDSKPLQIDADEVATWKEDGKLIFLMKGKVLVQMGVVQARFDQAAAWIDLDDHQKTRVLHMELGGEGEVSLANGSDTKTGKQAVVDLFTRGELKVNAHKGKVVREAQANDPLYKKLLGERKARAATGSTETGAIQPKKSSSKEPEPIRKTSYQDAAPSGPAKQPIIPAQQTRPPSSPMPEPPPDLPPPDFSLPGPAPPASAASDIELPPDLPPPGAATPAPRNSNPAAPLVSPSLPASAPLAPANLRQFTILPRTQGTFQEKAVNLPGGQQAVVFTGGVIINIRGLGTVSVLDIEADRMVLWMKGRPDQTLQGLRSPDGSVGREFEFYLAGNVEIREQNGKDIRTMRAEEVYYDLSRNVAVLVGADLEFRQNGIPDPLHLRASELEQLATNQFKALQAEFYSSRLPSDPGLKVVMAEATLEQRRIPKTSIFGQTFTDQRTGLLETEDQQYIRGTDATLKVEDVPVFYLPYLQGDVNDPLGPIRSGNIGYNKIFGFTVGVDLNVFDLFAITPRPGVKWDLGLDYLSSRGPAFNTNFDYNVEGLFGLPGRYVGYAKAFGIYDTGLDSGIPGVRGDNLGGNRGEFDNHQAARGILQWYQSVRGLPDGFSARTGVGLFSDKNVYEQYQKTAFDTEFNQETFLYVEQQKDNWAWTGNVEKRVRPWITETDQLPAFNGYLIGQSFFDTLTYNAHASAGYYQLQTAQTTPGPYWITDQNTKTGRFDLFQQLSLPFYLGPVKLVPYGVLDLTEYTSDIDGNTVGRAYGGGGFRFSMPLTRLYSDTHSDLFNLNGINHKIVLEGNAYYAQSSIPFTQLPQLDRLDDDATDQARRDFHPVLPIYDPSGFLLQNSPQFNNPQTLALRRLVDTKVDTLDSIEVFQADIFQRWQTKRGYPGQQHIVDFVTLDMSASFFPRADRDNFGSNFGLLEYEFVWNVGDRTSLVSTGFADPNGARVFTIGGYLNRPDRTNLFLGYRQIDLVGSQAVTGAISYVFSPKYAMTASTVYDFGTQQALSNSLIFTRMGSDLQVSVVLTYNALQNNFGFNLEIIPNALANTKKMMAGVPSLGTGSFLGR